MKPPFLCKAILFVSLFFANTQISSSQTLTRGPYLQKGTQTSIVLRWRTSTNCNSRVRIGTSYIAGGAYATIVDDASSVTEHVVTVTGLTADTKYYYSIGTSTTVLQSGTDNFFTTVPASNATRKIRIAAFGDCGRNSATYQDANLTNYRNYLTTNSIDAPDAWILLGDNAYSSGTDAEYSSNFFGIYGGSILKNHKLYPALGNHDYGNNTANKTSRVMPYYSNFSTFQSGEGGGVASNKPNFYSFDIGPIHFLAIDSWGIESDGSYIGQDTSLANTQFTWIKNDLAANTKKWTIAYWHHPPHTKSSHNSDTETELINIRTKFVKALEDRGVDMIVCGHSHAYERSYLMKGFFTNWNTFSTVTHAVSTSSATYTSNSTCPYVYNTNPKNHGTVYVVAGSAGASGGVNTNFNAYGFPWSVNDAGILYFEVEDNRLDAKMLRSNGTIFDRFTIIKDVNNITNYSIANGTSVDLIASWPQSGNYTWTPNVGTGRMVSPTPPSNQTTNYFVTDAYGCITDQFSVTTSGTLPVNLLNYEVTALNKQANVKWSTANESNNKYFTVERSANGRDFTVLGKVNGAGTSSDIHEYSFIDALPLPGYSFYRLSQTDIDNHEKYLGIKKFENPFAKGFDVKTISTNNNTLVLQVSTATNLSYQVKVYDLNGRQVKNESGVIAAGTINKEISLNKGVYIWEMRNEKGETISQKVSIQ